jgi:hypothetical protein
MTDDDYDMKKDKHDTPLLNFLTTSVDIDAHTHLNISLDLDLQLKSIAIDISLQKPTASSYLNHIIDSHLISANTNPQLQPRPKPHPRGLEHYLMYSRFH